MMYAQVDANDVPPPLAAAALVAVKIYPEALLSPVIEFLFGGAEVLAIHNLP